MIIFLKFYRFFSTFIFGDLNALSMQLYIHHQYTINEISILSWYADSRKYISRQYYSQLSKLLNGKVYIVLCRRVESQTMILQLSFQSFIFYHHATVIISTVWPFRLYRQVADNHWIPAANDLAINFTSTKQIACPHSKIYNYRRTRWDVIAK